MTAITEDIAVYRVHPATESDLLKAAQTSMPRRECTYEQPDKTWRHSTLSEAGAAVLRGESLLVQGVTGTSKTSYVQGLVAKLRDAGTHVDIISKTHTAIHERVDVPPTIFAGAGSPTPARLLELSG